MDLSIFLAKLLGLYLLIFGFASFFKREFFRQVFIDFSRSSALMALSSVINVLVGLLIVLNHNVWEFSWKAIITVLGYLSLIKGVVHLYAPEFAKKLAGSIIKNDIFVYSGIISLALGLYLLYHGFFEYIQMHF